MTEQNALRHYIAKGKRALRSGDYDRMRKIWSEACGILDSSICYKCRHDDFGYCGLRHSDMGEEEIFVRYCFPSVLASWENELNTIKQNRGIS